MRFPWRRREQFFVTHDAGDEADSASASREEVLDALVAAVARRTEVMEVIAAAGDVDEARQGLVELLGISEVQAYVVLDMQLRRFAVLEVEKLVANRDELRAQGARPDLTD